MKTEAAYQHCRQIIDKHSKTFSKAFQHLPGDKRRAVWAVYAFCRTADDIVDEDLPSSKNLHEFQNELDVFLSGVLPNEEPLWTALGDAFERFHFDKKPFYDMIRGQEMDLYHYEYKTTADVLRYSYYVASSVGLMLLPILAPGKEQKLHQSAVYLGYAMQITNILRDVGEDFERGRLYLPEELLHKYGCRIEMVCREGKPDAAFVNVWEHLAAEAETYYELGLKDIHLYPMHSRLPVQAAALLYQQILNTARRNQYDVFQKRAVVSSEEKKRILSNLQTAATS